MKPFRLKLFTVSILLFSCLEFSHADSKNVPTILNTDCVKDSDCRALPEINSGCSHYCSANECEGAQVCKAYRATPNAPMPDCYRSVPCRLPTKVWCESGQCKAQL